MKYEYCIKVWRNMVMPPQEGYTYDQQLALFDNLLYGPAHEAEKASIIDYNDLLDEFEKLNPEFCYDEADLICIEQ